MKRAGRFLLSRNPYPSGGGRKENRQREEILANHRSRQIGGSARKEAASLESVGVDGSVLTLGPASSGGGGGGPGPWRRQVTAPGEERNRAKCVARIKWLKARDLGL